MAAAVLALVSNAWNLDEVGYSFLGLTVLFLLAAFATDHEGGDE